jgi:hypothetical protein
MPILILIGLGILVASVVLAGILCMAGMADDRIERMK